MDLIDTPIDGITDRQSRAFWMALDGVSDVEIGKELGVDRATVWRWRQLDAWRSAWSAVRSWRQNAARAVLEAGAEAAAKRVVKLVDSDDEAIALRASSDVLDRIGVGRTTHQEVEVTHHAAAELASVDPVALEKTILSID